MKDPRRLLEEGATPEEFALLHAASLEEPPPDAPLRLRAALGLSAASATALTSATVLAKGAALGGAAKVGAGKAVGLWLLGASTVVAVSTTVWLGAPSAPVARPPAVQQQAPARAPVAVNEPGATTPEVEQAMPEPAPERPRRPREAARSIAQETARLDEARRALRAGDTARALSALDRYQRENPSGVLGPEAMLLRVETFARKGDATRATRLGQRFLREHADSPHAARVRELLRELAGD